LVASAGTLLAPAWIRLLASEAITVLVIHPAAGEQAAADRLQRGFDAGSDEVGRMIDLLGAEWLPIAARADSAAAADLQRSRAAVLLDGSAAALALARRLGAKPALTTAPLADGAPPNVFSVRASSAARERAVAAWNAAKPAANGARAVEWHAALEKYGAGQVNARFAERRLEAADSDVWSGWMAVKVAAEAIMRDPGRPLTASRLLAMSFDGHKGIPLRFHPINRHLIQPLQIVAVDGSFLGTVDPEESTQ
jgi:hypothetical protein